MTRSLKADCNHCLIEQLAIFRFGDCFFLGADQFDIVFGEHTFTVEIERAVECSLTAHRRKNRVRPFLRDDFFDRLPIHRLDVGSIRHAGIGHDSRRIRVDEDDAVTLFPERLTSLRAGIIEFTGLPDHDGAGADDQNAFYITAFWHGGFYPSRLTVTNGCGWQGAVRSIR